MPDPIYFQWHNEYLLRTIYPLRETKLRDFLVFYYEIDVWQEYKNKPAQAISGEVQAYRAAQKGKVKAAYDRYQQLAGYLLDEDVTDVYRASFPNLDPGIMTQINALHKTFKQYFPTYKNPVKEKYFASERVRQVEELQKKITAQIAEKKRILRNNGPVWVNKTRYETELQRLETVALKMVEQELKQLVDFLGVYGYLNQYRLEAQKQKAAREKELQEGNRKLQVFRAEFESLQARLGPAQAALQRLKNSPDMAALRAYFLRVNVAEDYRRTGEPEPAVLNNINEVHRAFGVHFPSYKDVTKEKYFIGQRLNEMEKIRSNKQLELKTAARLRNAAREAVLRKSLEVLDKEIGKLQDFQWCYEIQGKPAGFYAAQIAQAQTDLSELQNKVRTLQSSITALESALNKVREVSATPDKDLILAMIDSLPVNARDIARNKVEEYKNSLLLKDHTQLLEAVVQAFLRQPTRYPLWLQYMVVHFSGMRYQSAHGSWADPKDMLLALRMRAIEQNLRRAGDDAVRVLSEERYQCYQSTGVVSVEGGDTPGSIPALAAAKDPFWRRRIEHHIRALDPNSGYNKSKALLDLEIDEEDYAIQLQSDQDALSQLEGMKDQLPDWMWNEIVRCTNLRLTQVKQAGWEQASPEEMEQRYASGMAEFRTIMNRWKKDHLTGWREEHERTNQLIVTRAVCNEVAEHIQHIRGRTPPGGLTAKPEWYLRSERDPRLARVPDKPYFRKSKTADDFRPGASIFWLRWVQKEPSIWQITRPFKLHSGEELVEPYRDAQNEIINTGSAFLRRLRFKEKGPSGGTVERETMQWLRWMHEATVVEVAETADGPIVLTFETALPGEDRRQSTIGLFKRYVSDLKYNVTASVMNGTFVGYIPEGAVSYSDLREMLDWNRVLLREAYPSAQIEQYWRQVEKPVDPALAFGLDFFYPETQVEVAQRLGQRERKEWAVCYEADPQTGNIAIYHPPVDLRRGVRLWVSKDEAQQFEDVTYYPIRRCDYEPRAEGLLIRADDVIEAPEESSLRLAKARSSTPLYRLCHADDHVQPVFEDSAVRLKAGTKFLVSTVHRAAAADLGDGCVHGQGRQQYYLIVACPDAAAAEGLFILRGAQRWIKPVSPLLKWPG